MHKYNSRWISDLNVERKTIKFQRKTEGHPCDPGTDKVFVTKTQKNPAINKETEEKFVFLN